MKTRFALLLLLAITLCSCRGIPSDNGDWGRFSGPIDVRFNPDGYHVTLLNDVHYYSPKKHDWFAPKDSVVDGASIPQPFWSIIGGPFEGKYRDASVFHDVACHDEQARWQDVHQMFYTAMRCSGVGETKAKVMFAAVYEFGPKWGEPKKGVSGRFPANVKKPALLQSPTPTPAQVQNLKKWIEQENPSVETIMTETHAKAEATKIEPEKQQPLPSDPAPIKPKPTAAEMQNAAIIALSKKGPPYGYRFTANSSEVWTNLNGKRVWVKDAKGITGELGCAVEPLGVFIEEDPRHYFYRGKFYPR